MHCMQSIAAADIDKRKFPARKRPANSTVKVLFTFHAFIYNPTHCPTTSLDRRRQIHEMRATVRSVHASSACDQASYSRVGRPRQNHAWTQQPLCKHGLAGAPWAKRVESRGDLRLQRGAGVPQALPEVSPSGPTYVGSVFVPRACVPRPCPCSRAPGEGHSAANQHGK